MAQPKIRMTHPGITGYAVATQRAFDTIYALNGWVKIGSDDPATAPVGLGPTAPAWAASTVYGAGQVASDPTTGELIRRKTAGTSRASFDAAEQVLWSDPDGAYLSPAAGAGLTEGVKVGGLTSALGTNYVVGHRGATLQYPENTMEGIRATVASGIVPAIAVPVHFASDGVAIVNHDNTLDRTTNYTGGPNIENMPSAKILNAVYIQGSKTVPNYNYEDLKYRVPYLSAVLAEFGRKVNIWIELKSTGTAYANALVALLNSFPSLKSSIVVQDFVYADLKIVAAAGYTCQWLQASADPTVGGPAGGTWAQMLADGITYLGCDSNTASDANVSAAVAAGVTVVPYVVNYKYLRDHYVALGCPGVITDDPIWLASSDTPLVKTDPFASQAIYLGQRSNNEGATAGVPRGSLATSPYLTVDATGPTYVRQGWARKITAASGSITGTLKFSAFGSDTTKFCAWAIMCPDDRPYTNGASSNANGDKGYMFYLKPQIPATTGVAQINCVRWDGTSPNTGKGVHNGAAALVAGTDYAWTLTWTPTTISLTVNGETLSVTDSTYRGGYFHLGKDSGAAASDTGLIPMFKAITIP